MAYSLELRGETWELRIPVGSEALDVEVSSLCVRVGKRIVVDLPPEARLPEDAPPARRRRGEVILAWPQTLRTCHLREVSTSPLLVECSDFLDPAACEGVLSLVAGVGAARGEGVRKFPLPRDDVPAVLRSVYQRIDALLGAQAHGAEETPKAKKDLTLS